jgi:hypothetical protein
MDSYDEYWYMSPAIASLLPRGQYSLSSVFTSHVEMMSLVHFGGRVHACRVRVGVLAIFVKNRSSTTTRSCVLSVVI